jgi:uncharacterized protein (TIGR03437 family)
MGIPSLPKLILAACLIAVTVQDAWPQAQITSVVNAASFQPGLPSGGSLATMFCSGLNNLKAGTYLASSSPLPYTLGGLTVTVNNGVAPLLAVVIDSSGNAQINFQVPMERNASLLPVGGNHPGSLIGCGPTVTDLAPSGWGGFFADAEGYAVAQHASDNSQVTLQNPARAGETIILYADDFFPVWPTPLVGLPVPIGTLFEAPLFAKQTFPFPFVSTYFAETTLSYLYLQDYPATNCNPPLGCSSFATTPALQVTFEGLAPGQVGVEQINFVVPANQQPGDWALFFNMGSCPDGSGPPGRCGYDGGKGLSSPYVKLPVR